MHYVLIGLIEQKLILLDTISDLFMIKTIKAYSKTEVSIDFPG